MTTEAYEEIIQEGIKGLPAESLAEITDFVLLVRKRVFHPAAYEQDLQEIVLRADLKQLSKETGTHLEKEFEDDEQRFPRE